MLAFTSPVDLFLHISNAHCAIFTVISLQMSICINFDLKKFVLMHTCAHTYRGKKERERGENENVDVIIHRYLKIVGIHDFPKDTVTDHYTLHIAQPVPTSIS